MKGLQAQQDCCTSQAMGKLRSSLCESIFSEKRETDPSLATRAGVRLADPTLSWPQLPDA